MPSDVTGMGRPGRLQAVVLHGACIAAVLAAWEAASHLGWLPRLLLPAPTMIAAEIGRLAANGELVRHTAATLSRVFIGLALGGAAGALAGLAMGWSRRARSLGDPLVAATYPIPKIAVLPLIMVLFGIGNLTKVIVIAVSAFFPMLISAMAGVAEISPIHFEVARNCGANPRKVFTRVVLPGSLPLLLTGVRLALNTALLLAIAVELVLTKNGLGSMIWLAWQTLRVETLYASLLVISALGIACNGLLQYLSARLVPWQQQRTV